MSVRVFNNLAAFLVLAASLPAMTGSALAANPEAMTVNYAIAARARLMITPGSINFPDSNPSLIPKVPAAENPVLVTVKFRKDPAAALTATLVCQGGPLTSGGNTIPAAGITWTAAGSGFTSNTLSSATPQTAGSWSSSGSYSGTLAFFLDNLWSYAIGSYSGSITFTLTAP